MYTTDNVKIGKHLADLIRQRYKSDRKFCIQYLKKRDESGFDPDDVQKMQNRICQIKKGKKGIQIEDLPIFSELLGVSAEDILSAGTYLVPATDRKTNYTIAYSSNPAEWEAYIGRDDKPFLNPDEFNKTVIDYALEAGNYPFLKHLLDKKYIWFVGDNKEDVYQGFGAGTSVKRREVFNQDLLDIHIREQDDLRFRMITLAIENKETKMLDSLKARELPLLHTVTWNSLWKEQLPSSPNVTQMIECIAQSPNKILSYFFDEFDVESVVTKTKNTYVFPFAGAVLDLMIKKHRHAECVRFIEKAIAHNKKVQKQLQGLIGESVKYAQKHYQHETSDYYNDDYFRKLAWEEYYFCPESGFVAYHMPFFTMSAEKLISNVINVTATSKNEEVQSLIDELKNTYNTYIDNLQNKREAHR